MLDTAQCQEEDMGEISCILYFLHYLLSVPSVFQPRPPEEDDRVTWDIDDWHSCYTEQSRRTKKEN